MSRDEYTQLVELAKKKLLGSGILRPKPKRINTTLRAEKLRALYLINFTNKNRQTDRHARARAGTKTEF